MLPYGKLKRNLIEIFAKESGIRRYRMGDMCCQTVRTETCQSIGSEVRLQKHRDGINCCPNKLVNRTKDPIK